MSEAATAGPFAPGQPSPTPARQRLRRAVAMLTRARRRQLLFDHACAGLLAGLCLATVTVLIVRALELPWPHWQLAGTTILAVLGAALVAGWLRRPDPLDVAIRADLRLNLKQRLSTAWERMAGSPGDAMTEQLAVQAVRAGLPPLAGQVFPMRVNRWGRLAPLAGTALLLAGVLDPGWLVAPAPRKVDEKVVREGERLAAFAQAMQARARRDRLPHSTRRAEELERLAARMESGALARGEALEALRNLGEKLQADAARTPAAGGNGDATGRRGAQSRRPESAARSAGTQLPSAPDGPVDADERDNLPEAPASDVRPGSPRPEPAATPGRQRSDAPGAADTDDPRDLRPGERDELDAARDKVRRARENLGGTPALPDRSRTPEAAPQAREERDGGGGSTRSRQQQARRALEADSSGRPDEAPVDMRAQRPRPQHPAAPGAGPLVRPPGQPREGAVFTSPGIVLPRPNRPTTENVEMKTEYTRQLEAALANEQYPAHYKDFIRRYFLLLSRQEPAADGEPAPRP